MTTQISLYRKTMHFIYEGLTRSRIIFIVGDLGVHLYHYKRNVITDSVFCPINELSSNILEEFIAKYSKSDAKFILNTKSINLQHESLPVVNSIGKQDPVQNYCDTHFHQTDLFTYKVHTIVKEEADIWKAAILWLPMNNTLERCLNLVKDNNLDLSGFYFHPVSMQYTAEIIAKENNLILSDFIYLTISVSITAGISITLHHGNNILASITCDYPMDKSTAYIQGIIEQNASDMWLKFKSYIAQYQLKKLNIFVLTGELKDLISSQVYEVEKSIFAKTDLQEQFADILFLEYFTKTHQVSAKSRDLIAYYRYHIMNKIFFKFAYILVFALCFYATSLKKDIFELESKTDKIYTEYFKATEELRDIAQNFPNVTNVAELADFYNAQNNLAIKRLNPFAISQGFIELASDKLNIMNISWELDKKTELIKANIKFDILNPKTNKQIAKKHIEDIVNDLKAKNPDFLFGVDKVKPDNDQEESLEKNRYNLTIQELKK